MILVLSVTETPEQPKGSPPKNQTAEQPEDDGWGKAYVLVLVALGVNVFLYWLLGYTYG